MRCYATMRRRHAILLACLMLVPASPAAAQMEGRVGVGVAVTRLQPTSDELSPTTGVTPFVRLSPKRGWGISAGLNWAQVDVDGDFAGVDGDIGRIRMRPLMGGVGYTFISGRLYTTLSVVGGPAWNTLKLDAALRDRLGAEEDHDAASFAVRPGVGVTYALTSRFGLTGFGGFLINRPKFSVDTSSGEVEKRFTADAFALSAGIVVTFF